MAIEPTIKNVMRFRRNCVFLQWDVEDMSPQVSNLQFTIERSSNEENGFEEVATGITDNFYVDEIENPSDEEINTNSAVRSMVYRVGLEGTNQGNPISLTGLVYSDPVDIYGTTRYEFSMNHATGAVPNENQIDPRNKGLWFKNPKIRKRHILVWRAKARKSAVALRLVGDPLVVLKRRHWGTRCSVCLGTIRGSQQSAGSVPVMGESVFGSVCNECYGTSWQGGYYSPIQLFGIVAPQPAQVQDTQRGKVARRQSQITIPASPWIEKDDLIVELSNNNRWVVEHVDEDFLMKRRTDQHLHCVLLGQSRIEQNIPVAPNSDHVLTYTER